MESRQKKLSFVFALLIGGFWIFAFRYHGVSINLKAPPIRGNLKPGTALSVHDNDVFELRKKDKNSKSIFRRRLSFCNHAKNTESKGKIHFESQDMYSINIYSILL